VLKRRYLQSEEPVLVLHLLGEEIRADGRLVLVTELLVHISELHHSSGKHKQKQIKSYLNPIINHDSITRGQVSRSDKSTETRIAGYWFIKDVFPTLDRGKSAER
jgi:hypothetical protein